MKMWLDYHIDKMDFGFSINTTAPLLGELMLLEQGIERPEYRRLCKRFADWCMRGTCVMDSYQEYDAIGVGYSYFT